MKGGTGFIMSTFTKRTAAAAAPARAAARFGLRVVMMRSLVELEPVWRNLERNGCATIFQAFDTFAAWAQHIAPPRGGDWFVIVVCDRTGGQPLMLLPFVACRQGLLSVIEAADLNVSDFNGPVLERRFTPTAEEMAAIWEDMRALLPPADILRLTKLPGTIGTQPNPLLLLPAVHKIKLANFKTPLVLAGQPWSVERLNDKLRCDLAARRRKLDKRGKVTFVTAQTPEEINRFYDAMIAQRRDRCAAMGRDNILDCLSHRAFYRALLDPGGVGRIQALLLDDQVIATGYGLLSREGFHMIFPTFKAEGWRNYSPGMQLFIESMAWAAANGIAFYDFTIGGERFKASLGAEEYPLFEHLEALTARGRPAVYRERLRRLVGSNPRLKALVQRARALKRMQTGSTAAP
ncbi:MAG: GNAT family N-acetyltransferase [Hyphomicrobiaceae bacterium]